MPVELVGQQLRIRVKNPSKATRFRTQDVGGRGKLQRVAALYPKEGWKTQSWRLNLSDYAFYIQAESEAHSLYTAKRITLDQYQQAVKKMKVWYGRTKGGSGWHGESRRHALAASKRRN